MSPDPELLQMNRHEVEANVSIREQPPGQGYSRTPVSSGSVSLWSPWIYYKSLSIAIHAIRWHIVRQRYRLEGSRCAS